MNRFIARQVTILLVAILLVSAFAGTAAETKTVYAAGTCFANASAGGANDGSSWMNAYTDLQLALTDNACTEIWVAAGTYKPTSTADRNIPFQLKSGVAIYGGFVGTETSLTERDPAANVTILSGDIDNNDSQSPIITDIMTVAGNSSNSYNVVDASNVDASALLDGFTITGGYANGVSCPVGNACGAGMVIAYGNPTLTNLVFTGNYGLMGGGLANIDANPSLQRVTFKNNRGSGGAIYNSGSSPTLTDVTIDSNSAPGPGGGISNRLGSNPTLTNVTISNNTAQSGGGIYNDESDPTLINATLYGNSVTLYGGAIFNGGYDFGSSPTLNYVTITGNSAGTGGGGMYNEVGPWREYGGFPVINGSIFWNNGSEITTDTFSTPTINDSIIEGGCPANSFCVNNVTSADPKLDILRDNGGYTQTVALLTGSPAIDAGGAYSTCPTTDQRGATRPQGTNCDIGAFESGPDLVISKTNNVGGTVALGNSWQWTIRVTNNGSADAVFADGDTILFDNLPSSGLGINSISANWGGGASASGLTSYIISANLTAFTSGSSTILPPGGWVEVVVTITPTTTGTFVNPRSGGNCKADPDGVIAESDENNNTCSDTVIVTAPAVTLSASTLDFGNQLIGTASAPQTVTVTNSGDADLHLGVPSATGDFSLSNDTCSNATVPPSASCTFDVTFSPLSFGPKTGSASIPSDAASSPESVFLTGNGVNTQILRVRSNGVNDGMVRESTETSGIGNYIDPSNQLLAVGDDSLKRQYVSILDFNTSSLPDHAVVTSAILRVKVMFLSNDTYTKLGSLRAVFTNPFFGSSLHLEKADFGNNTPVPVAGVFSKATGINQWITLRVLSNNLSMVNSNGHTQFRIYFPKDDSNDVIKHQIGLLSGNYSVLADRPLLTITYYVP